MASQQIFCNVPWTNLHIYWDGSYGVCCSEVIKPYEQEESTKFNLDKMSIEDWYSSSPMLQTRKQILSDTPLAQCDKCYREDRAGYESRRVRENFKSVIFTEQAFRKSYQQSPTFNIFENSRSTGETNTRPIDWHVDLGNECNLACKMCFPRASSKIAKQYKRWNLIEAKEAAYVSWTENETAWNNFLQGLGTTPNLNRVHFMGGEPLLNKRFEPIIDFLISHRPDTSVSFVSNGTMINQKIIDKLLLLRSCDIEISIETVNRTNDYIRQGSNIERVLDNIEFLNRQKNDKLAVVIRTAPQLLSVNSYYELIDWCFERRLSVQGNTLWNPRYLRIQILPDEIKQEIKSKYTEIKNKLEKVVSTGISTLATGRTITVLDQQLLRETNAILSLLDVKHDGDLEKDRYELIECLSKWDREYSLNALEYYPEYEKFLIDYGYGKI